MPTAGLPRFGGSIAPSSNAGSPEKADDAKIADRSESGASETDTVSSHSDRMATRSGGTPNGAESNSERQASLISKSSDQDDAAAMGEMTIHSLIADLEESQPLDAETKRRLIDDLQRTPPHLWPAVVRLFRATLAYRRTGASGGGSADSRLSGEFQNDAAVVQAARQSPAATDPTRPEVMEATDRGHDIPRSESLAPLDEYDGEVTPAVAVMPPPPTAEAVRPASVAASSPGTVPSGPLAGSLPSVASQPTPSQPPWSSEIPAGVNSHRPSLSGGEYTANALPRASAERDWRYLLNSARWQLESQVKASSGGGSTLEDELRLRLLNLALSDREGAVRPIAGLSPNVQDFWSKIFFGLSLMIADPSAADMETGTAALEAQRYLEDALHRLQESGPLEIRNPAFVTAVQSWGVYEPFEKNEFSPGRPVLLYAEIENLKSESTAKGYRTSWQSSYRIIDDGGRVVADYQYTPNEEYCRRVRRDFFIGCELSIPSHLTPGRYTLRLSVTDLLSRRTGETSIEFSVPDRPRK